MTVTGKISDDVPATTLADSVLAGVQDGINKKFPDSLFLAAENNLSELADPEKARDNLGLGSIATESAGNYLDKATYDPSGVEGNAFDSDNIAYDNSTSGLSATSVRGAIDELAATIPLLNFLSVSDLRGFSGVTEADVALVVGWHALTSTGGGFFRRDAGDTSTPDDGGTCIIDGAGRRWKRDLLKTTPYDWGAQAGTAASQHVQLQAMLDSGIINIDLAGAHWRCDQTVTRTGVDTTLRGGGGALDFSFGNGQMILTGTATQISNLASDVVARRRSITLDDASGVREFSLLQIFNPTDYSYSGHRASYRAGEFLRVHSVSDNDVRLFGLTFDSYAAADVEMWRIDGVRIDVDDLTLVPSTSTSVSPLLVDYGDGVRLGGSIRSKGGPYVSIQVKRSYDFDAAALTTMQNDLAVISNEYGLSLANVQRFTIHGSGYGATRHAIHLGGFDDVNCVPVRDGKVFGAILTNSWDTGASDGHGNCDHIEWHGCTMLNEAVLGGSNQQFFSCTIFGNLTTNGHCAYGSEIVGGLFLMKDCTFISDGSGVNGYVWMIATGPSSTPTGLEGLRKPLTWILEDCTWDVAGGASARLIQYNHFGSALPVKIVMHNPRVIRATQIANIAYVRDSVAADFPSGSSVTISGDVDAPSSPYLVSDSTIATLPLRLPRQHVSDDAACTTGQSLASISINYRHTYPRRPRFIGGGVSPATSTTKDTWGGKALRAAYARALNTGNVVLAVGTIDGGNFSSDDTVRLGGAVDLAEF